MTALRWFLSYLIPMLILAVISASYFYRDQISSNWYHTLSWPVAQINAVLQQQKLRFNFSESTDVSSLALSTTQQKLNPTINLSSLQDNSSQPSDTKPNQKQQGKQDADTLEQPLLQPIELIAKNENPPTTIPSETKTLTKTLASIPKADAEKTAPVKIKPKTVVANIKETDKKEIEKLTNAPKTKETDKLNQQPVIAATQNTPAPVLSKPSTNPVRRPITPTQFKLNNKQRKILYQARNAFWDKDLTLAKKHYLLLIKQLPDNPDIQGELGNIFYIERKTEKAIKHYSLAATSLIKQQHFWKLSGIMPFITRFNQTKADEIMRLMHNSNKKGK